MSELRLDRFLANAGYGTRSEVKALIRKGQVTINNELVKKSDIKVDLERDQVQIAGNAVSYSEYEYYLLHKPAGCVTATEDSRFKTVMDYLDVPGKKKLFPVGRLDRDSEGLLLITNDGALAHELLAPKKHVKKTYFVRVAGMVTLHDIELFKNGLDIGDEKPTLAAKLEIITADIVSECLVTIEEGRFHQVKRMFEAVDKKVLYLKRTAMGALVLEDTLDKGCFRTLTEEEIGKLKGCIC